MLLSSYLHRVLVVERMGIFYGSGHTSRPVNLPLKYLISRCHFDNVAAKAGYSKWHLQRMLWRRDGPRHYAYIRARRLSK